MPSRLSSRRTFLGTLASAAAIAPWIPLLEPEAHATGGGPKRIVFFYTPNGTRLQHWRPTGGESNFELSPILSPLAPMRDRLTILDGIDNAAIDADGSAPGNGHQGTGTLLTGARLNPGNFDEGGELAGWASGPSLDQFLGQRFAAQTPFASLELAVNYGNHPQTPRTRMSFRGSDDPVAPDANPYSVYDRVFAGAEGPSQDVLRRLEARKSVFDGVTEELARLQSRVSAADRVRLEQHAQSVRSVEQQLSSGLNCSGPELPGGLDGYSSSNYEPHADLQIDLLAAAIACGSTRVASLFFMHETAGPVFSWLGQSTPYHELSHLDVASPESEYVQIQQWMAQKYLRLLHKLDEIPEGSGSVLDNTVVVWMSPISNSWKHANRNIPVVLAGSCGGALRTGRVLRWGSFGDTDGDSNHGGRTNNDLLMTLAHAMDEPVDHFGDADLCTGLLEEMLS